MSEFIGRPLVNHIQFMVALYAKNTGCASQRLSKLLNTTITVFGKSSETGLVGCNAQRETVENPDLTQA